MVRFSAFIVARDFRFPPRSTVTANRSSRHCQGFISICHSVFGGQGPLYVNAGWSWGWVSAIDAKGRTIWIVDAHRDDGTRFIVRADELFDCVW
jgi:hypothetical protein